MLQLFATKGSFGGPKIVKTTLQLCLSFFAHTNSSKSHLFFAKKWFKMCQDFCKTKIIEYDKNTL